MSVQEEVRGEKGRETEKGRTLKVYFASEYFPF